MYSIKNAKNYSELGIAGTTYEASFNELRKILDDDLKGKVILDYGTGTGRSAQLLKILGAKKVIGLDHDRNMIRQAQSKKIVGIKFKMIKNGKIPLDDQSVDIAVSAHVFVEVKTLEKMLDICKEIARVLKPNGVFVIISTNPQSVGYDYVSYRYQQKTKLRSGDSIICVIKGNNPFEIEDAYWTQNDYQTVLTKTGFVVTKITYPIAQGTGWLDETKVAPDIVIQAKRISD